jgi:tRNA(Ile)-lysidine synthase
VNDYIKAKEFHAVMESIIESAKVDPDLPLRIAVAVSGGRDSMALAILAKQWMTKRNKDKPHDSLQAIIVDHAMRKESAAEAQHVKQWLEKLDIPTEITTLSWKITDLNKDLKQKVAREKRFAAIDEICVKNRVSIVLFGQHLRDRIETMIMRLYVSYELF